MELSEQVCAVVSGQTGIQTNESTSIESLAEDSLELLDLLMAIENQTGLRVPDSRIAELNTIGDILRVAE